MICPILIGAGFFSVAQGQTIEYAKVSGTTSNFVVGGGTSGFSNTLNWSGAGTAIGGSSQLALNVVNGINANVATNDRLTTFSLAGSGDALASLSLDLGSNVLVSDIPGYFVNATSLKLIDYGVGGAVQFYDFKVGLWDGTSVTLAGSLTDLAFTVGPGSGSVSYLGSNLFRFTETSTGTGSDLAISSALAGSSLRTFSVGTGGFEENGASDLIALLASRTLTPVPEPQTLALSTLAVMFSMSRRRQRTPKVTTGRLS